jgi:tyrosyl-tRNA synthetase
MKKAKAPSAEQLTRLFGRGTSKVYGETQLKTQLSAGKQLRIYYGVDPTGPVIHLGHAVILRKLRLFQQLGHEVILLIGSFTAQIGDPSDKDAARKPLSLEEVMENAETYKEQASKIISFTGENAAKLKFNSDWLAELTFTEVVQLAHNFTVQQLLERDMYQERLKANKPIGLHEFFYPLMQGYDSVAMEVDIEIGGTDQTFNMLAGRTLMKKLKGKEKSVITIELLEGTDGRKMSKSFGNLIAVTADPSEMYGGIMSLRDELIVRYFELCTDLEQKQIREYEKQLKAGDNPRDVKAKLAHRIVTEYHSGEAADKAEHEFTAVFRKKEKPSEVETYYALEVEPKLVDVLEQSGLAQSRNEARRLIEQGGVKVDGEAVEDIHAVIGIPEAGLDIQVGKRRFLKLCRPT